MEELPQVPTTMMTTIRSFFTPTIFILIVVLIGGYLLYKRNYEGFQSNPCEPGKELGCFKRSVLVDNKCLMCPKGNLIENKCVDTDEKGETSIMKPKISSPSCFIKGIIK